MITLIAEHFNPISQTSYEKLLLSIELHNLSCTCGHRACLVRHGYYKRTVKTPSGDVRLRICRVKCSFCGRTHALLPASIVPYCQISLEEQVAIIEAYEKKSGFERILNANLSLQESNLSAVLLRYKKHWKQRLLSERICLFPLCQLVSQCFSAFERQFLQIKRTCNCLFVPST